jgi:hypothetical protein
MAGNLFWSWMFLCDGSKGLRTSDVEWTARFEVLRALLLNIEVLWDVNAVSWLSDPENEGNAVAENVRSVTPVTQYNVPENRYLHAENC